MLYQLSYISPAKLLPCYREANPVSTIRSAKKPNNSNTAERNLPGSIVFAAKPHNTTNSPSPIHMRARDPGAKFILRIPGAANVWCTGEDSNLRSSKERQIYSLLPLTARPPVHNLKSHHSTPQTLSRADQQKRSQDVGVE